MEIDKKKKLTIDILTKLIYKKSELYFDVYTIPKLEIWAKYICKLVDNFFKIQSFLIYFYGYEWVL